MMEHDLARALEPLIELFTMQTDQALARIKPEAKGIIEGRITDEREIEYIFDDMLSYGHSSEITELFKKSCREIYDTHTEIVNFYVQSYIEMWQSDDGGDSE